MNRLPESSIDSLLRMSMDQRSIIEMQSDIIDELFRLLAMYIGADEIGTLPVVDKIRAVVERIAGQEP